MNKKLNYILIILFTIVNITALYSQTNSDVKKVYVVFKTHLDVGFTDLSSKVTERYINEFIPKALDVSERLRDDNSKERYVWTTGSWLVWKYLQTAPAKDVERLERAIKNGDIVWNSVPYTVESESMNLDLFETLLLISNKLDKKYGKHSIAAKMTDVPGHTRSIIEPMNNAGIKFLHIGVNPASPIPNVPEFSVWKDPKGGELILVYQQDYGSDNILPGGEIAISVNFTGDNHGPHTYEKVKEIYKNLQQKYPNAQLIASSFNEIAQELLTIKSSLPVVTSEIGDTWIYGYGSAPIRMAKFRAMSSLYSAWLKNGKIKRDSDESLNFALELGLIAEHTQGMDIKTHLANWDKYDMDVFIPMRKTEQFKLVEESWKELDNYIYSAIKYLPESLQKEALSKMEEIDIIKKPTFSKKAKSINNTPFEISLLKDNKVKIEGLIYQMFDQNDYDNYLNNYLRARYGWALDDIGKTGIDKSKAVSVSLPAQIIKEEKQSNSKGVLTKYELSFGDNNNVDPRVLPQQMFITTLMSKNEKRAEIELSIIGKPAVRLPESYWFSFNCDDIISIVAEKIGKPIDVMDVVEKGNRQMHGIDNYVDIKTSSGTVRIKSEAAFLINIGEAKGINYNIKYPNIKGGVHFNLSNNLWGTNFTMWNEGSLTYRFVVELID